MKPDLPNPTFPGAPPHPSSIFPPLFAEIVRAVSGEGERTVRLPPEQLEIIREEKWFNLFVPAAYGGLALSLPEALLIEEALAWTDGSMGWTVTLCSGANWFVGFLDPVLAGSVFAEPGVCFAGSGRSTGVARRTEKGYEITGSWSYATGAPHATVFTANCRIEESGSLLEHPDGSPVIRSFLFLHTEVSIIEDWRAMGLMATASHRFEVSRLEVPANRCFIIDPAHAVLTEPIYRYPFLQFAETTLAVNSSGMAARFIGLAEEGAIDAIDVIDVINVINAGDAINTRDAGDAEDTGDARDAEDASDAVQPGNQHGTITRILTAKEQLALLRLDFYAAVEGSWQAALSGLSIPGDLLEEVSRTSRNLAAGARKLVDELYPFCGLRAADRTTEINRVWRNLHTASQHSLLR